MPLRLLYLSVSLVLLVSGPLGADTTACSVQQLEATTVRAYSAPEASQGAAGDKDYFYAVGNGIIAKYRRDNGQPVSRWGGEDQVLLRHINSCYKQGHKLSCANSNFPAIPMGSSIEIFDTGELRHLESNSLGLTEEGSLTWFDKTDDGWIASFVHYDGRGGVPYKSNGYTSLVRFDNQWRRTGGWLFPPAILKLMAPHGTSGGAIGPDGYLYVTGHDLPQMYVLAKPSMGPYLLHIATVAIAAHGQAFSWLENGGRDVFAVNRGNENKVLVLRIPEVRPECIAGTTAIFRH